MAKTVVQAAHDGQHINGHGGCHTRWSHDGFCCGVGYADWLNSLGDDSEVFITIHGKAVTNGDVRANWLQYSGHLRRVEVSA